jgi:Mg-chelatase subunit ChlD
MQYAIVVLTWLLMVLALARPQRIEEPVVKTQPGRDMLIAVDLSGSMEAEDFTDKSGERVDRVTAVKQVLGDFLENRDGDRVGLIFFGTAPFLQVPFTEDLDVCRSLLDEARARMAGPQTMLGDAIGKAINVFEGSDLEEKVLILLTDGNDTNSQVPPIKAAEIAADRGITIHTIGMGDPTSVGEEKLDMQTLVAISAETGGSTFLAIDRAELEEVYVEIDKIAERKLESLSYRPVIDLFFWPLAGAMILTLAYHVAGALRRRRAHSRQSVTPSRSGEMTALASAVPVSIVPLGTMGLGGLHLMREGFLWLAIPAALLFWLLLRQTDSRGPWQGVIEPQLLKALLLQDRRENRFRPVHMLGVAWLLGIVALVGPAWQKEPSPFTQDEAALVIALEVTPSMLATDVQPTRLERAVHKISDLLEKRPDAATSLVAYAGSAHLVIPLTSDPEMIKTFAAELSPDLMPREGEDHAAALGLARKHLENSNKSGSILLVTDGVSPTNAARLAGLDGGSAGLVILGMVAAESEAERESLQASSAQTGAALEFVTADHRDIEAVLARAERNLASVADEESGERWRDEGYWIVPVLCALNLFWFRPGWVIEQE